MSVARRKFIKVRTLEEHKAHKSSCTCEKCIACCKRTPGWFLPEEIIPLADFLKLSVEETYKKYLIMDYWVGKGYADVLAPFKVLIKFERENGYDNPGQRASFGYAFKKAPCIFFKNDRCKIYSVRPFECASSNHTGSSYEGIREIIANEWRKTWRSKGKLQKTLKQLEANNDSQRKMG